MNQFPTEEIKLWTYRAPLTAEAEARLAEIPNPWANPNNPLHVWTPVQGDGPMAEAGRAMYNSGLRWTERGLSALAAQRALGVPQEAGVDSNTGDGVDADEHAKAEANENDKDTEVEANENDEDDEDDEDWVVDPQIQAAWDAGLPSDEDEP